MPREGEGEAGAPRSGRNRNRDRYGRDRRERAPRDGEAAPEASLDAPVTQPMAYSSPADEAEAAAQEAPVRSYFSLPAQDDTPANRDTPSNVPETARAQSAPVAPVVSPVLPVSPVEAAAPIEVAAPPKPAPTPVAPRPAPVVAQAPAAAPAAARALPKVQAYALSIDELQQVAQASGLEWVNSDQQKVAQVQAAIAAEPKPIHVPREPQPPVVIDEGPLVLVETRKDLRNMTLPFEG